MPIYEFYCADCHRVFSFLSRVVDTTRRPACPRCGRPELPRRPSVFAVSRGATQPTAGTGEGGDDARLEKAMESLAGELETMDEKDAGQMARLARKLYGAAGMPLTGDMETALRRLEAGEDPEKVEQEMGEAFGEGPFGGQADPRQASDAAGPIRTARRALPPSVDSTLYEL